MKICDRGHIQTVPLLFTFKFPGAEYWCPICGANFDVFGSGETVDGTPEPDRRHEVLEAHCHDYLSSRDATYLGLTEERLLELEAEFDPGERPTITCDGCGVEVPARVGPRGETLKPSDWYQRTDDDGTQTACGRDCISVIAKKSGKTSMVMPF